MLMRLFLLFLLSINLSYAKKSSFTAEETKFLEELKKQNIDIKNIRNSKDLEKALDKNNKKAVSKKKRKPVYVPSPLVKNAEKNGFLIDRDSTKIKEVAISYKDAMIVNVCFSAGVSIALDDSFRDEFQRVIKDDDEYFDVKTFENNRGAFVKLKQPIEKGRFWESALRLITKSNDKTILINLIGRHCPEKGVNPYPKVYYLKEKYGLIGANTNVMTPEDTIIEASEGYPRINKNVIRVYDMVASSNSNWVVFGIEVQFRNPQSEETQLLFKVLDNHQVSILNSKQEHLEKQSVKATQDNGFATLRFNLKVNINKDYILNKRYIYLLTLDKVTKHYQYKRIDLKDYFNSLRNRGFKI